MVNVSTILSLIVGKMRITDLTSVENDSTWKTDFTGNIDTYIKYIIIITRGRTETCM